MSVCPDSRLRLAVVGQIYGLPEVRCASGFVGFAYVRALQVTCGILHPGVCPFAGEPGRYVAFAHVRTRTNGGPLVRVVGAASSA